MAFEKQKCNSGETFFSKAPVASVQIYSAMCSWQTLPVEGQVLRCRKLSLSWLLSHEPLQGLWRPRSQPWLSCHRVNGVGSFAAFGWQLLQDVICISQGNIITLRKRNKQSAFVFSMYTIGTITPWGERFQILQACYSIHEWTDQEHEETTTQHNCWIAITFFYW